MEYSNNDPFQLSRQSFFKQQMWWGGGVCVCVCVWRERERDVSVCVGSGGGGDSMRYRYFKNVRKCARVLVQCILSIIMGVYDNN